MSERPPGPTADAESPDTRPRSVPPPLLDSLALDHLDPGYRRAADRRASGPARSPSSRASFGWLLAGTLVIGLLLAVAFQNTRANSAGVDEARVGLIDDVTRAQQNADVLESSVSALNDQLRSARAAAGGGALAGVTALEQMNALLAVTGPGLRIALDDPEAATGNGAVLDRDIQLLVNGLWSAGAEAVAISGVRLRLTSAIRQAGGAILVDNRPVLWPMTIEAIGDPSTLQQRFVSTPGYGRFSSFVQLYGVDFEVTAVGDLALPAAAAIDARYIEQPQPTTASNPTAGANPTTATTGTTPAAATPVPSIGTATTDAGTTGTSVATR